MIESANNFKKEKLNLKLLYLGEGNRYIEIKNPEYLLKDFPLGEIPTRVLSYRDETPDSLKEVQRQTVNKLGPILYPSGADRNFGNIAQLISTAVPDGAVAATSFGSSSPLVIAVGTISFAGMTAVSGAVWNMRNKSFNKKISKVRTNLELFEKTPTDKFERLKDEELEDIANAIENNQPLKNIKPKSKESYNSICNIFYNEFNDGRNLTSRAREVYQQKIDAYREIITRA